MPRERDADNQRWIGSRISVWRRAVLLYGPGSAKKVALTLAEFAWADAADPDGDLLVKTCSQRMLMRLCDYSGKRGLLAQLQLLEECGWISRDHERTSRSIQRTYTLTIAPNVPDCVLNELNDRSPGMWERLIPKQVHDDAPDEL